MPIGCTGCRYCMPCPHGVDIPGLFRSYNEANMFDQLDRYPRRYEEYVRNGEDVSKCVKCGLCEKACPQHLPIRDWLQTVHKAGAADK